MSNKGADISDKVNRLLEKEEELKVRALAITMRRYHEDPSTQNLRNMEAAKKAMKEMQNKKPKPDAHEDLLESAYQSAADVMGKKPTTENVKTVETARKALRAYRSERSAEADPARKIFTDLIEVLDYLQGAGYKIQKSKLYKDRRKIEQNKNGTYAKKSVDHYAKLCLDKFDNSDNDLSNMNRKAELEIKILEEKHTALKRDNDIESGRWVKRSDQEGQLASRAALLMEGVGPGFIHAQAGRVVEIVQGDPALIPELITFWLGAVADVFEIYSRPLEFAAQVHDKKKDHK